MALTRLVEHFTPDINTFKTVQKHRVSESEIKSISDSLSTMKLSESTKKYFEEHPVATLEGKTVWRLPISRYDNKNENGRVYEKRLWQRVIDEQKEAYQGNSGLADHPDDDSEGKFKQTSVVWLNMGLDESNRIVWAEGIFVGGNGRLAEEVMESGGRVGFSTSGFGELDESDKSTVRWDSYQLERPADIVLNPSQKVYGNAGNKMGKRESVEEVKTTLNEKEEKKCCECGAKIEGDAKYFKEGKPCCCQACANAEKKDMKKENTPMSAESKLSKLEERKFRRDVGVFLDEADKVSDPQEKLEQLNEILAYFAENITPDLKESVEKRITAAKSTIEKAVKEYGKIVDTFGVEDTEALKEGVKKVAIDTQFYERDASEWKTIAEGLQDKVRKLQAILASRPTTEAYKTSLAFSTRMKEVFKTKETELLNTIKEYENHIKRQNLIENQMIKELASISAQNEKLAENNVKLREYGKRMREMVLEYEAQEGVERKALDEAKAKEKEITIAPYKTPSKMFESFNQNREVTAYYKDLLQRHGEEIEPYKDIILASKTLNEAMKKYLEIMSGLGASKTSKITEALEPEERQRIIETQTGTRIRRFSEFEKRLPDTWE